MDGRIDDPFERNRLKRFHPNPMLVEHYANLSAKNRQKKNRHPEAGKHNLPHFQMMKDMVVDALRRLPRERSGRRTAVVLGAKECNDIPLEILAEEGDVCLVDVDPGSMDVARKRLQNRSLSERVHLACMDASLFETVLINRARELTNRHASDIDSAFHAVVSMHEQAAEGLHGLSDGSLLPIHPGRADLVVSSMTLSQFLIGYVQILLRIFQEACGGERTRNYFLAGDVKAVGGEPLSDRIALLQRSTLSLARSAAEAHVRELCRIVRGDGIAVLSDHALHGQGIFVTDSEVDVDKQSLKPYSKTVEEDKVLRQPGTRESRLPASVRVDVTRPDETFTLEGFDTLKNVLSRDPRAETMKEQRWWWVTERAGGSEKDPVVWHLSYVEAYTFRSRYNVSGH